MNKLDVALKLLQLLNERKTIDSKTVAQELNVSIRTAQRYLVELSILPCVIGNQDNHSYSLNPDYQVNGALKQQSQPNYHEVVHSKSLQKQSLARTICLLCGGSRISPAGKTVLAVPANISNLTKIDRLAAIISKRLKNNRCGFPRRGM